MLQLVKRYSVLTITGTDVKFHVIIPDYTKGDNIFDYALGGFLKQ
jgi:hypothetical protein